MNDLKYKFDYCISNPPYQVDNQKGSVRTTTDIYPIFQKNATYFTVSTAMIYPASWQKNILKDLGEYLLNNGLKKSIFYKSQDVFDNSIRKNFPISVVYTEKNYNSDLYINNIIVQRNLNTWIDAPAKQILLHATNNLKKIGCGVVNGVNISNVSDSGMNFTKEAKNLNDPVKVYAKALPGKQADGSWWYIERSELLKVNKNLDLSSYKCVMASAPIGRLGIYNENVNAYHSLGMKVLEPNHTFSNTWVQLAAFNTKEKASNYTSYMNTKIATILIGFDFSRKSFGSYVPELEDYSNNNLLFTPNELLDKDHEYYGLSLDERLCLYLNLTQEESAVVLSYSF